MRSYCNIFGALHLAFVANAEMTVSRKHGLIWCVYNNMDRYMIVIICVIYALSRPSLPPSGQTASLPDLG